MPNTLEQIAESTHGEAFAVGYRNRDKFPSAISP
jgi:hypothetical protein